ncbi:MAG: glycine zipper 2TM domain-containing protein [Gallionella sp.]
MKSSAHTQSASIFALMALTAIMTITACSQKPSTEESAAQTKVIVEDTKKQMLVDQAAEKAKQEAAQAEEKARQEAAVAAAKKEILAEQHAAAVKAKSKKFSSKPAPANKVVCINCGVVLSINEIQTEGKGSGLGVIAGGVVGGLLGNQVGNGTGRDLATVAGAVGGAVAGNKIEKNSKRTKSYDITVKMDTGEQRIVHQTTAPEVAKGDAVKIENEVVVKR